MPIITAEESRKARTVYDREHGLGAWMSLDSAQQKAFMNVFLLGYREKVQEKIDYVKTPKERERDLRAIVGELAGYCKHSHRERIYQLYVAGYLPPGFMNN